MASKVSKVKRKSKQPVILMTGFAPFGLYKKNPSWEGVRRIKRKNVTSCCLPVNFRTSHRVLYQEIKRIRPDYVFSSGVSASDAFKFELRCCDARHNNMGAIERTPMPKARLESLAETLSIIHRTVLSEDAGQYVCEHLAYWLARFARRFGFKGCFVHVPNFSKCFLSLQTKWWRQLLDSATAYK